MSDRALKHFCEGPPQYGLNTPATEYADDGLRFLRTTDINDDGSIADDSPVHIPSSLASPEYQLRSGDILLSRSGSLGRCLRYTPAIGPATFAGYLVRFRPKPDVEPRYLEYCTRATSFQQTIEAEAISSTISNFNAERYANLAVPWWPLERQRAIADYLDTETARIDALIAKKHRIVELLLARHRSLIDDVMRVELEADASQVSRLRLRYVLRERDVRGMMNEEVLSVYRDHGVVPKASRDDNFNKTPPDVSNYKLVCPGDVVVNKMKAWQGSVAVSSHRGIVSGDYLVCEPVADVETSYLHYQLRSPRAISEYVVRSSGIRPSQWRLYWDDFGDIAIPIPSPEVQQQVVQRLDYQSGLVSDAARRQERMIGLLEEHRQALITAAVTGESEVPGVAA